ncbi:OmpH family outer membrane protein [Megalodesulfovibrio gigas]|uniref:Putative outer membrane chaperone Skp n=1 Tax=Megalodesulfovibrio gigas (strain ATCC 19364 / DSM 1382 / NCIMB 9332 / VKM B-1759) TaxID=1121448 RepID=T2G839_MEGG1|nr:OmpH family outer membrane protein [Megalodesulfovibrio gigas]AGW12349.1 putative outer membrane chaperone Skp [Megalodesulfovibrio gigas DSM 1382 = ATCC 19364]
MRKAILLAVLFCLTATTPAFAQDPVKIGVFSLRKVMLESAPGKKAYAQLKNALEPEKNALAKEEQELKKLSEDFKKLAATLSQEGKESKQRELQKRFGDFQMRLQSFQKKASEEEARLLEPFKETIFKTIQKFGSDNRYTLILVDSQGGVAFAAAGIDVTDAIMNELSKGGK